MPFLITLFSLFIILWIYLLFFRKELRLSKEAIKEKHTTPHSYFLNWKGNEIHYTDEGDGFPILMVHGFGGSYKNFEDFGNILVDRYRIIKVDLPGFGMSDFPKFTEKEPDYNEMYLDFFDYFIKKLELGNFHLMGCSMGGLASWRLSLHFPERIHKLVLFNSAGYDIAKISKGVTSLLRYSFLRKILLRGIPISFTNRGLNRVFYNPKALKREKVHASNDFWNREGNLEALLDISSTKKFIDPSLIQSVNVDTLIIWGQNDKLIPVHHVDYFLRDISKSKKIVYENCGHAPMIEIPHLLKDDVIAFLEEK
ncbi:MAG: alpha/beta hydrolase [Bacteroidetes bacterium]|jgi:pimeloyl-ACP methyl ester carboxylesterase|nr:alpha/beta hydrolase [Bacteroidota bacterium]